MASSTKERRYPRIALPRGMSVAWQISGEHIVSRVSTLGLGGLFIDAMNPASVGDVIQLVFDVPDGEVRSRAVVRVSHRGQGMGVEFTAMLPEARGRLHGLLKKLIPNNPRSERRSTRVSEAVFLTVSGVDAAGQPFVEQTGTMHLSLHGCSYFSRYAALKNSWVSLEIPNRQVGGAPHGIRARIVWSRTSRNLPGLFQVGLEFEVPVNISGLANPPEDWRQDKESGAVALAREIRELLTIADTGTHYQLLGIAPDSPLSQAKSNYHELVRKYHPDGHMNHPEQIEPLQKLTRAITSAYKTLNDDVARKEYDRQLIASGAFALGRPKSELQQTIEECVEKAQQCFRAKNYGGAILWWRKAVDIEPVSSTYHTMLARSLSAVPAYRREALEHLQKAIGLDSLNAMAHFQLAELYEEMKLPWRARPHYEKVLEIDEENRQAQERLRLLDVAASKSGARKPTFIDDIFGRFSNK